MCVCVCVCSRLAATFFVRSQPKSASTGKGLRKNLNNYAPGPVSRARPRVKFLDDANATHSSSFEHTPTPVLCRLYALSSFAKIRAIEYLLPTKLITLLVLSFLSKFRLHLHRIQPTRFLQQGLHGKCVDFYRNKREEQDSNSFRTFGISQQRLHVTCPQTYLYTTVSCPYEGRAVDSSIYMTLYKNSCTARPVQCRM